MNKGLEELKDLKNAFIGHCRELKCEENYIKVCENKFGKIEKELKEGAFWKGMYETLRNTRIEELNIRKSKKEQALEIIRKKKVNPYIDVCCYNNYNHYLEEYEYFNNKLTQEEFDLLKEVLL